MSGYFIKVQEG